MFQELNSVMIRKAVISDVKPIHKLLGHYGDKGLLLARPLSELYDHLRDFFVMENSQTDGSLLGVCALGIYWEDLAEVRSLAVDEAYQGKGYGAQLVGKCLEEAKTFGLQRVFALTYVPDFFSKLGFRVVEKSLLPQKVWADCLKCAKFPDCDEIAMIIDI